MNWKEFFKPSWSKVFVYFFILPVLILLMSISPDGRLSIVFALVGQPFIFIENFLPRTMISFGFVFDFIFGILDFAYWYLLSCAIVWVYSRFGKKKSRR